MTAGVRERSKSVMYRIELCSTKQRATEETGLASWRWAEGRGTASVASHARSRTLTLRESARSRVARCRADGALARRTVLRKRYVR